MEKKNMRLNICVPEFFFLLLYFKSFTGEETCFALIARVTDVHLIIQINETSIHTVETSDITIESTVTERFDM